MEYKNERDYPHRIKQKQQNIQRAEGLTKHLSLNLKECREKKKINTQRQSICRSQKKRRVEYWLRTDGAYVNLNIVVYKTSVGALSRRVAIAVSKNVFLFLRGLVMPVDQI